MPSTYHKKAKKGGGASRLVAISEAGLNRIIARSDAALREGSLACEWVEWVFGEVLPSLRKTGGYVVTAKRRAIAQSVYGWADERGTGKKARRRLTDSIKDLAANAQTQGANEDKAHWLYSNHTRLTNKLVLGDYRAPMGGRDAMTIHQLAMLGAVEDWMVRLIDDAVQKGVPWDTIYPRIKEKGEALFGFSPSEGLH